MSDFEILMCCLLIPIIYVFVYIAGKYDLIYLICKMLEEKCNEFLAGNMQLDINEEKMREIIFRGKRIDNGEWVYGYLVCDKMFNGNPYEHYYIVNHNYPSGCYGNDIYIEVDHVTIGQYTGSYDEDNTKIFEGDIVFDEIRGNIFVARVAFLQQYAGWVLVYGSPNEHFSHRLRDGNYKMNGKLKVIGNIYDNPELLNNI